MLKKSFSFILCFLLISPSFAQSMKDAIDKVYIEKMSRIKYRLTENCFNLLSPVITSLEASHQLFLNDNPLDAVHKNVEILHDKLPYYKNSGCNLAEITENMMAAIYIWYYLDLTGQIEQTPAPGGGPTPTDFEKFQLVNVANSISNKISLMCQEVSCDEFANNILGNSELIKEEMLYDNPDYHNILHYAECIKKAISHGYYFHRVSDKRYYEALSWVLPKTTYLYKIPKKYLFELNNPDYYMHYIASTFADFLINYNIIGNGNFYFLSSYSRILYLAARYHNIDTLLKASVELSSLRYNDSYYKNLSDVYTDEYVTNIVDWFNNETFVYFKSYYETQKIRPKITE